jgi:hypothetical protein
VVEGATVGRAAEPLRLPPLTRLEWLAAPKTGGSHGRAAKAQSAHTRAASRMTVAGSRIMLGPRRWREEEPDCPASRQRRVPLGGFARAGASADPNGGGH